MCLKAKRNWVKGLQLNAKLSCCITNDSNNKVRIKIPPVKITYGKTIHLQQGLWAHELKYFGNYCSMPPSFLLFYVKRISFGIPEYMVCSPGIPGKDTCLSLTLYLCFHKLIYQPQRLYSHFHTGGHGFKMHITKTVIQNPICKPCYGCQGGQLREQNVEIGSSPV